MLSTALVNRLEVWGFENGTMVFRDFSLGVALKLSALDISCLSDESVNLIKTQVRQFLNGLGSGLSLQFVQEIVSGNQVAIESHKSKANAACLPLVQEITEARAARFLALDRNGELPRQNLYLFIRQPFTRMPDRKSKGFFKKKTALLKEDHLRSEIHEFGRVVENLRSSLTSIGLQPEVISDQNVFGLLYDQWNPGAVIEAPRISTDDVRDQLCLTDAVIGLDHFVLGKTFHKVITLKLLPENTFSAMVETLRKLPFDSKLYLSVEVLDQHKEVASLQMQRRMAYASVVGKKGVADLEAQAKLQDIESLLEEMIQGVEKAFKFSLNVLLKSDSEDNLESQVADTLQKIREMNGAEGMLETVASFDIFNELAMPNSRAKERAKKVNTSVLADLIPLYGSWKGFESPNALMRTREGGLFSFDPFSSELGNSNMIVSGGSGVGKSYFANALISQMLNESPKIFILDIGGSYRKICENLNGQYIELGLKSALSINPFSMDGLEKTDPENVDRKIKFLVALVEIMTKEDGRPGIAKLEKSELERLIRETMAADAEPRLSDLMNRLLQHSEIEMKKLGKILGLWCGDAPYGKFVDRPTTVKLDRDVVCFDLKGLDPELQSVCLFLITDLIWREVQRDRTQMKFTIFDECWKILQDETALQFVGEVYRTFRKYRASAIAISQTMDDFAKSKIAAAIMPNSSIRWILRQKGADQKSLKEALQLNDREMEIIGSLESQKGDFSDAFLMAEDRRQVVRIESTPLEYWLFTSDPIDLALMNKAKTENPALSNLDLLRLCADQFPNGASGAKRKDSA